MVNERTSLFADSRPGPSYAIPGRFSRPKTSSLSRLQCYICALFLAALIVALVISIVYAFSATTTEDDIEIKEKNAPKARRIDGSEFLNLMASIDWPITDEVPSKWLLPPPTVLERQMAVNTGVTALGNRELFEEDLPIVPLNTPSYKHQKAVSTTSDARKLTKRGYVENYATMALAKQHSFKKPRGRKSIGHGPSIGIDKTPFNTSVCNFNSKYRQPTGMCNNKEHPFDYGVAYTPYRRALNPDYADGITQPRSSNTKTPLPSARTVSLSVHRPSYSSDPNFTVMLAVFGQFLDHDITATALNQGQDGDPIDCCTETDAQHAECYPVELSPGDPNYDLYNVTCMNFVRSAPSPTDRFGPRQQLNQASAFIDGSVIYGATDKKVNALRTKKNGLLRMFLTPDNRTLLPVSTDPSDGCNELEENSKGRYCFESGDTRANENLHLTSMHLIWARHHNYVAEKLQELNPKWDDEKVFQEARRIVGAQLQHIAYNEFLPTILGQNFSNHVGLSPKFNNSIDIYDETIDASIANVFAACAFRFAHTLIPGLMTATKDLNNPAAIALHEMLFNPYSLWANDGLDNAIGGAIRTPLARSDPYFTTELTEKLFISLHSKKAPSKDTCGLDLVSLNIQRGRDHGLPAYPEWREFCGLPPTRTWNELAMAVDSDSLNTMKLIYKDVENIDVYTGALSEPPVDGAIVGPLLACLITDQFLRIKRGDSHWYERKVGPQSFSTAQLNEIYGTTLASIICRNSDAVHVSQRFVMRKIDASNPLMNCSAIDTFRFDAWKEHNDHQRVAINMLTPLSSIKIISPH